MKHELKKVFSVLLIIVLLVSLFTACTGGQKEGAAGEDSESTETEKVEEQPLDPFSLEADMKIYNETIAKIKVPDIFKNSPTYTYTWLGINPPQEDGSFGQKIF